MIRVSNFVQSLPLQESLQTLSINKFAVIDSKLTNLKTYESSEVIIADAKQAQKLFAQIQKPAKSLIIFFDDTTSIANIFELASKLRAFAVIGMSDLSKLEALIEQAHQYSLKKRTEQFAQGKTIGIFSSKGGVGKSFLAYHLASQLKQFTPEKPLLIDLGVPMGSARSLLHVQSTQSWQVLRPLLSTGKDLTTTRLQAQVTNIIPQFSLLNAPADLNQESLSINETANLIEAVKVSYPITVVDLPTTPTHFIPSAMSSFDLVLWVLTPDANSLTQTVELFSLIQSRSVHSLMFVCNQVEPHIDQQIVSALRAKLQPFELHSIDNDPEAIKIYQRKFELISDETLIVTAQLKELTKKVFFTLSAQESAA